MEIDCRSPAVESLNIQAAALHCIIVVSVKHSSRSAAGCSH